MMQDKTTLGQIIGANLTDDFDSFDFTLIQNILATLALDEAIDIAHAEMLQQKSLHAADMVSEYMAKLVKMVSFLETKINSTKNKVALEYKAQDGKTTADMKKQAGESSPEVESLGMQLARAKGTKVLLEKKYDVLIRSHHHYKDIANSMRKGILSSIGGDNINAERSRDEQTKIGW